MLTRLSIIAVLAFAGCGSTQGSPTADADVSSPDSEVSTPDAASLDAATAIFPECEACADGELCVPVAEDAPLECVQAQCVDYGSENPTAVAVGWQRKVVDDAIAKQAVCNNGCPYAYYVRPGVGADADNWVFFFKGGGACAGDANCALRWATQNFLMRQKSATWTPTGSDPSNQDSDEHGLLSRGNAENHFGNWTQVFLTYCSSDSHSGTAAATDNNLGFAFRGNINVSSTVSELLAGIGSGVPNLTNARNVLIWGGSAGSSGARRNMDRMATTIRAAQTAANVPSATIKGLADSAFSPAVRPESFVTEPLALDYWKPVLDEDCMATHEPLGEAFLCLDGVHMVVGTGQARGDQVHDQGHLRTVDDVFVFMDQYDNTSLSNRQITDLCVRTECDEATPCAAGTCEGGVCLVAATCEPTYCESYPCYGLSGPDACFQQSATHAGQCDDDSGCASTETCVTGFCTVAATSALTCPDGYVRLERRNTPFAQAFAWGVRRALNDDAVTGAYSTNTSTHTAAFSHKFYKRHFGTDSFARVLARWYTNGDGPYKRIKPAASITTSP